MKKFLSLLFFLLSLFSYGASIEWEIKEKPNLRNSDKIEDVIFTMSAILIGKSIYNGDS